MTLNELHDLATRQQQQISAQQQLLASKVKHTIHSYYYCYYYWCYHLY